MSSCFINLNGDLLPASALALSVANRAFRYGVGLFETMLVQDECIRLESFHWDRLREGMSLLGMAVPADFFEKIQSAIIVTLRANQHEKLARLRLQVWPGEGAYYDASNWEPQFSIESTVLSEDVICFNETGLAVGIAHGVIKHADPFSHLKSCGALPYVLAARQASREGWDEALLLNQHSRIADASIANVFWISEKKIFTPPLSEGCVAGVMRRHLLRFLPAAGYAVEEEAATLEELQAADVILLTNALRPLRWVSWMDGHKKSAGIAAELHLKVLMSF